MHLGIECAQIATLALAYINTHPNKVQLIVSCCFSVRLARPGNTLVKASANISFNPFHSHFFKLNVLLCSQVAHSNMLSPITRSWIHDQQIRTLIILRQR